MRYYKRGWAYQTAKDTAYTAFVAGAYHCAGICGYDIGRRNFVEFAVCHAQRQPDWVFRRAVYRHVGNLRDGLGGGGYLSVLVAVWTACDFAAHSGGRTGIYDGGDAAILYAAAHHLAAGAAIDGGVV